MVYQTEHALVDALETNLLVVANNRPWGLVEELRRTRLLDKEVASLAHLVQRGLAADPHMRDVFLVMGTPCLMIDRVINVRWRSGTATRGHD